MYTYLYKYQYICIVYIDHYIDADIVISTGTDMYSTHTTRDSSVLCLVLFSHSCTASPHSPRPSQRVFLPYSFLLFSLIFSIAISYVIFSSLLRSSLCFFSFFYFTLLFFTFLFFSSLLFSFLLQILGNNECIEPYTSNMYVRRVRAGEFIVVNPHLLKDLVERGLWTKEVS